MARKKKSNQGGGLGGLFFKAGITLIVVLVMIGSFLLFVAWVFFERKYMNLPRPKSLDYFDLTKEEVASLARHERSLSQTYARLNSIEIEGRNLSKRQDGFYNERSQKGKEFNAEIVDLRGNEIHLVKTINDIKSLPDERLKEWSFYATTPIALRISCLAYVLSFALFAYLQPKWVTQLSNTMQKFSLLDFYASYPLAYGASIGALVISLVFLFVAYFIILDSKIEKLSNANTVEVTTEALPISQMLEHISQMPYATLKLVVDNFEIDASKRSKSTIMDAIQNQGDEMITKIYHAVQ